jgi:hypothetical protein
MKPGALLANDRAAAGAEFALVLPILLLCLFGIIDAGRFMWNINRAEKAAQMGVRMAVVTDYVSSEIGDDYVGECTPAVDAGEPIPEDCYPTITCNKVGGTTTCTPVGGTADGAAFDVIVNRMRAFMPEIQPENVEITYSPSGLGYAGDPNGADLAPLVTVRLSGVPFEPMMLLRFASVGLPEVRSSLTFEDGIGSESN